MYYKLALLIVVLISFVGCEAKNQFDKSIRLQKSIQQLVSYEQYCKEVSKKVLDMCGPRVLQKPCVLTNKKAIKSALNIIEQSPQLKSNYFDIIKSFHTLTRVNRKTILEFHRLSRYACWKGAHNRLWRGLVYGAKAKPLSLVNKERFKSVLKNHYEHKETLEVSLLGLSFDFDNLKKITTLKFLNLPHNATKSLSPLIVRFEKSRHLLIKKSAHIFDQLPTGDLKNGDSPKKLDEYSFNVENMKEQYQKEYKQALVFRSQLRQWIDLFLLKI